jgi:hypothetical protein
MNADTMNRWLSLGANIGVVIGLILLLIELDQNSDLARAQIHQARADEQTSRMEERADTDYLAAVLEKLDDVGGFRDLSALNALEPEEVGRLKWFLMSRFIDYDNLYYQYQQGYLDQEYYDSLVVNSVALYAPWWEELNILPTSRRPSFDAEIRRIMAAE